MRGSETKKTEAHSDFDQMGTALGIGAVVLVAALFALKYLPVLILGLLIGFLIYTARFQEYLESKIKTALFTAGFFAVLFFVLFGLPVSFPERWQGALFYSKSFCNFCVLLNQQWNELVPSFLKGLKVKQITELIVTQYVWMGLYAGLVLSALFFILGLSGKFKSEMSLPALSVAYFPARLFFEFTEFFIGYPMGFGAFLRKEKRGFFYAVAFAFCLGSMGYILQTQVVGQISSVELRWILPTLVYVSTGSLVIGFLLSFGGLARKEKPSQTPGFYMGKTFQGRPYRLSERNLNYHVEIIAPTGSGKTNLLKGLMADRISKGHGIIFLDFKAEFDIVSWIYRASKSVGRENQMRLFSLSNRELSVPYNPLKFGDATDIHSALMNAMTWSESFYRGVASVALMTLIKSLCEYRDKTGELFHLGHLYKLLDQPGTTRVLADRMASLGCSMAPKLSELASRVEKPSERSHLMGLMSNLNQLLFSSAGDLLSQDVTQGSFDFREALSQGRIVTLLMNSLKLKESAQIVGKMILQDLMSLIGDHYAQIDSSKHKPLTLIIDEFASFATPNFIEFMDRARGAGIGIVMAHQARADLRAVSPEFQERVEANSNTTLVSGLKSSQDAEHYAGILGTRESPRNR